MPDSTSWEEHGSAIFTRMACSLSNVRVAAKHDLRPNPTSDSFEIAIKSSPHTKSMPRISGTPNVAKLKHNPERLQQRDVHCCRDRDASGNGRNTTRTPNSESPSSGSSLGVNGFHFVENGNGPELGRIRWGVSVIASAMAAGDDKLRSPGHFSKHTTKYKMWPPLACVQQQSEFFLAIPDTKDRRTHMHWADTHPFVAEVTRHNQTVLRYQKCCCPFMRGTPKPLPSRCQKTLPKRIVQEVYVVLRML